ncbi:uncharacterized protein CDAR_561291 [Caerostris darwini]|uniref:Uncharacterized protein n=1 Tax=Caerostris darwini TaxID=1538125 RepID=A0AAV4ST58_9ARAC|nr:uncharacterized protein CDAR_561291 [Caerostris darwini]
MYDPETQQTAQFLWNVTNKLSTTCPAASRFYMSNLKTLDKESKFLKKEIKPCQYCKHCGSLWIPGNHKIRIQSVPHPNAHIKKLLKWEQEESWKLNTQQKKKLKKFRETTNKIIYTCNTCKKTTTFPGLKKYSTKDKNISFSTPVPKIKLKKGDLNAGLFIKTPVDHLTKKPKNKLEKEPEILKATNFSERMNSSEKGLKQNVISLSNKLLNTPNPVGKVHLTPSVLKQNSTPQLKSSSKKKKGLLKHILNQEQEAKKQKKGLSSFLISL